MDDPYHPRDDEDDMATLTMDMDFPDPNGDYLRKVLAELECERLKELEAGGEQVAHGVAEVVNADASGFGISSHPAPVPPVLGTKRKSNPAPPAEPDAVDGLEAGLRCMRSSLKSAIYEAKTSANESPGMTRILRTLEGLQGIMAGLITKKGKLVSPLVSPLSKRTKEDNREEAKPNNARGNIALDVQAVHKPSTTDASTDTPVWWAYSTFENFVDPCVRRDQRDGGSGFPALPPQDKSSGANAATGTEPPTWSKVTSRSNRKASKAAPRDPGVQRQTNPKPTSMSKKPPALLIKPSAGRSYSDTVRSLRTCGLTMADIGTDVKCVRPGMGASWWSWAREVSPRLLLRP